MAFYKQRINVDHSKVKPISMQIWFMQTMFWVLLTVVTFFSLTLWYGSPQWTHITHILVQSVIGVLITTPMHWVYRSLSNSSVATKVSVSFFLVLAGSLIWTALRMAAYIWITDEGEELWGDFGGWYFGSFFIFYCWTAVYFGMFYYHMATIERDQRIRVVEKSRAEKLKRLQAEKTAAESRMQMLRYQLNPHFLFNTLNAVNSLIVSNELKIARETVEQLSTFLRYTLKEEARGWVSLASEVEALELYLNIEKIRFSDRLSVVYDIDPRTTGLSVPSLLLQPLVENAIKYAVNAREDGSLIRIEARLEDQYFMIAVEDSGPGILSLADGEFDKTAFKFSGVGIQNIVDRLDNIYGNTAELRLINKVGSGLRVEIELPLRAIDSDSHNNITGIQS